MPVVPPAPPPSSGLGVAALILGILAVVLSFTVVLGFALGVLAIVFGAIAISRARAATGGKGMGIAGLVLGIVGIAWVLRSGSSPGRERSEQLGGVVIRHPDGGPEVEAGRMP